MTELFFEITDATYNEFARLTMETNARGIPFRFGRVCSWSEHDGYEVAGMRIVCDHEPDAALIKLASPLPTFSEEEFHDRLMMRAKGEL
jgi:hypothetical protein